MIQLLTVLAAPRPARSLELVPQLLIIRLERIDAEPHLAHLYCLPLEEAFEQLVVVLDLLQQCGLFLDDLVAGVLPPQQHGALGELLLLGLLDKAIVTTLLLQHI